MFPRWLPLYLLGLAALTLFPFAPPECESGGWVVRWGVTDFSANLIAFVPIGLALHRSTRTTAIALAFTLSLTIELSQHWLPRLQDVSDLISNTLGAVIGYESGRAWVARWDGPLFRAVTWRAALWVATPMLLALPVVESFGAPANDFSNWHPYPLVIGNTAYGDRPWMGEVSSLAIFDRPLAPRETAPSGAQPDEPALWAEGGPILWLRFGAEHATGRIDGPAGPVRYLPEVPTADETHSRTGLRLVPSGLRLDDWVSNHVVERLRETGTLTVDLGLQADVLYQHGPARIVSLGDGGRFRNLMLAQQSSGLVARIRTPANGRGGMNAEVESYNVVTQQPQDVRLTYDGSHAVLLVDGVCEDATHMALANAGAVLGPFLGVNLVVCTALSALALATLGNGRGRRLGLAFVGAASAFALLYAVGAWDHLVQFNGLALVLGALSFGATVPILRDLR
jgi:hypothetical protein